ncbi:MAG: DUF3833 family protein [Limimaricola sp.]|uniref:DUF3833 domain-containing protein n=1 Tax=Limimaricola sp. TaxID=2211665 RepID=UPI001D8EE8FA|nr:DUF3833 domain-containing protein [Limimaricola sp.]MBI1416946.1 DUF3833 family protein [Limimaricola sp.]
MAILPYLLIGAVLALAGVLVQARYVSFWAQKPEDYASGPAFDIRERLNGPIVCEGVIFGPTGRVSSRFVADFEASWQGNVGIMTEVFTYDSGAVQNRQWKLTVNDDGEIQAEAPDVVGVGRGRQKGSAVLLNYRIKLAEEAGGHVLNTTDWMYLTPNGVIMNRSQFRKFGIKVAELVATMRPRDAA